MSLITRNNYEAYLLDYIEENLSPELVAELMLFLEKNLDLKEELDEFEVYELTPLEITLIDKDNLKKDENITTLDNYEELIIAEIEGENTTETSKKLQQFLKENSRKQAELVAYQETKLVAPTIIFENKESLKKREGKVIPMYWWYSSAAAVITILFLLNVLNNDEGQKDHSITDKQELVLPVPNKDVEVSPNQIVMKENQVAIVEEEELNLIQRNQQNIKKESPQFIPEEKNKEAIALVDNSDEKIELIKDSIPQEIIKEFLVEHIQYADNVKITYEEEAIPAKKITKLNMIQTAIKQRVKESNLSKAKEKIVLAFNSNPLSFLKKKDKN